MTEYYIVAIFIERFRVLRKLRENHFAYGKIYAKIISRKKSYAKFISRTASHAKFISRIESHAKFTQNFTRTISRTYANCFAYIREMYANRFAYIRETRITRNDGATVAK